MLAGIIALILGVAICIWAFVGAFALHELLWLIVFIFGAVLGWWGLMRLLHGPRATY